MGDLGKLLAQNGGEQVSVLLLLLPVGVMIFIVTAFIIFMRSTNKKSSPNDTFQSLPNNDNTIGVIIDETHVHWDEMTKKYITFPQNERLSIGTKVNIIRFNDGAAYVEPIN